MKKIDFISMHKDKFGDIYSYDLLPENFDLTDKIKIKCKHGIVESWAFMFLNKILCTKCFYENISRVRIQKKANIFKERSIKVHGDKYDYSKFVYLGNHIKGIIICKKHGEFLQEPISHIRGRGCPKCANEYKRIKFINKNFYEKVKQVHGDKYNYFNDYVNIHSRIKVECKYCGNIWYPIGTNHLHRRSGCPKCKVKSEGENRIRSWLINNFVKFEEQKRFDDCKNKKPLPFDFYIKDKNILIEFDGKQHYDKTSKYYNKELVKNDNIKNEYCIKNGIKLIRLNNLKQIENVLSLILK